MEWILPWRWSAGRLLWAWLVYWVSLFVVMHIPVKPGTPMPVPHTDKLLHFLLYFLLTCLAGRYFLARDGHLSNGRLAAWAVIFAVYGAVDEWLQSYIGRTMSFYDWVANVAGILGATLWLGFSSRRARKVVD